MERDLWYIQQFWLSNGENCYFDYQWVDESSIEILCFHGCDGVIEIPERISEEDGWIRGLAEGALELSGNCHIILPNTIDKMGDTAITFKQNDEAYSYPMITVPLDSKIKQYFSSNDSWSVLYYDWGRVTFIPSSVICRYTDELTKMEFDYTMIDEKEVKIIKWYFPKEEIKVPSLISEKLSIASIGSHAFTSPDTKRLILPSSVKQIDNEAVYFEDSSKYIKGDLYDFGWRDREQCTCELWLPLDVHVEKKSFVRETECSRRWYDSWVENNLIIISPENSLTNMILQENGWIVNKTFGGNAILISRGRNSWDVMTTHFE